MKIGTFNKQPNGALHGTVKTLLLDIQNIVFEPIETENDNLPSHRVFIRSTVESLEIGAAWEKVTGDGLVYNSVQLDDPSLSQPIYCALFLQHDGSYSLVFDRIKKKALAEKITFNRGEQN